jgi:glycosyltransferase involved in cell wall biosynthesis
MITGSTTVASSDLAPNPASTEAAPIHVFAHLAHGYGASGWQARWERGEIIGLNEHLPYGFFWAREQGCVVVYSEDRREGLVGIALRLGFRFLLGFDLVHAWRNRRGIYAADIVWTGTESQYLGVLLLLLLGRRREHRPKVVAQSVWLFDKWPRMALPRRALYRRLIADAAVLTVHSPVSIEFARTLFPRQRSLFMPYGIAANGMSRPGGRAAHHVIRVVSAGSDCHRDWATLVTAVRDRPDIELKIVTRRLPAALRLGANVSVVHPASNDEYLALYRWADVVALSLTANLHGSGITVIEEAVVLGVPVVATDTGGLREYFSDQEIRYVPMSNPDAMRKAIEAVARDEKSAQMAARAQRRMVEAGLTSRDFARRYAQLSRELMDSAEPTDEPASVARLG